MSGRVSLITATALLAACASGVPTPAALDERTESCRSCRMAVSDARFAAQLVAAGEEPRFFDDLGCLRDYLRGSSTIPTGAVVYVADHRTKAWLPAATAVFTRVTSVETPMGSHWIAHADASSRDADPQAHGGAPVPNLEVLGPSRGPR